MKLINHLREFYGFPQALLARYVGVSRGHISMAEIGRKDLQTAAFLKLIKLSLAVKSEWGPEMEHIKANHRRFLKDKEEGFVNHKILETEHRLMGCQRKLRRMQIKHRQSIHALACLAVLQANPEDPDIDQYKVMEMFTRKILDKNSEVAQLDLELRIAGLEATAEFLRQRVAARERLAAAEANAEEVNWDQEKPTKISTGVNMDNNNEVVQFELAARTECLEAKAASLPGRLAVEGSQAAIPANPGDPHINQDELMGIAASGCLYIIGDEGKPIDQKSPSITYLGLQQFFSRCTSSVTLRQHQFPHCSYAGLRNINQHLVLLLKIINRKNLRDGQGHPPWKPPNQLSPPNHQRLHPFHYPGMIAQDLHSVQKIYCLMRDR